MRSTFSVVHTCTIGAFQHTECLQLAGVDNVAFAHKHGMSMQQNQCAFHTNWKVIGHMVQDSTDIYDIPM